MGSNLSSSQDLPDRGARPGRTGQNGGWKRSISLKPFSFYLAKAQNMGDKGIFP